MRTLDGFMTYSMMNTNSMVRCITPTSQLLELNVFAEKNEEYLQACKDGDLVEIADALGDMMYILYGSICKHGLQHKIADVFDEIHRSNMSKLDENGQPIYWEDGKVMKSSKYFKPNIKSILNKA